jgi:hypothetical protein
MAKGPQILSVRIKPGEESTVVTFELGIVEIIREIPKGRGVVRFGVMLDSNGKLSDAEIVTDAIN